MQQSQQQQNWKTFGAVIAIAFLVVLVIATASRLPKERFETRKEAVGPVVLSLTLTGPATVAVNQEFDVNVLIDTKGVPVSAAQLNLTYDSSKLQGVQISHLQQNFPVIPKCAPGGPNYFADPTGNTPCTGSEGPHPAAAGQISAGTAAIILGARCEGQQNNPPNITNRCYPLTGNLTIASMRFRAVTAGNATIAFNTTATATQIAAINVTGNALDPSSLQPLTVTISGTASTATPTTGCAQKSRGDADCDGAITIADAERWRKEFNNELTTKTSDFNGDGIISIADRERWRKGFNGEI